MIDRKNTCPVRIASASIPPVLAPDTFIWPHAKIASMKNPALLSLTVLLLTGAAVAQPTAPAKQPTHAIAPAFAPDRLARIDALLNRYIEEDRIAGAVALVL